MKKLNILIVDDVFINQFLLKTEFEKIGLLSKSVKNGRLAIDELQKNNYDIVFIDIEMPEMNGIETVNYIRKNLENPKNKIPLIALTAHNSEDFGSEIADVGFNDIIFKPYNFDKILQIIEKYTHYKINF